MSEIKVAVTEITITTKFANFITEVINDKRIPNKVRLEYIKKAQSIIDGK